MTITEFLVARIAEREDAAKEAMAPDWMGEKTFYEGVGGHRDDWGLWTFNVPPQLVLAECEAMRRIVDGHAETWPLGKEDYLEGVWRSEDHTIKVLASVHADHPDFQDEWRTA